MRSPRPRRRMTSSLRDASLRVGETVSRLLAVWVEFMAYWSTRIAGSTGRHTCSSCVKNTDLYVYLNLYIFIHIYFYFYVYVCVLIYIHAFIHSSIHSYIHTHSSCGCSETFEFVWLDKRQCKHRHLCTHNFVPSPYECDKLLVTVII